MHRRPRLRVLGAAAALLVVLGLVAGAVTHWWRARPVAVTAPAAASDPACAGLAALLPGRIPAGMRVPTTSGSPAVAAWGSPAVVWRCGVTPPGPTALDCIEVDGVDWVHRPLDDGSSFTSYGREPAVQVLVPRRYAPEPMVLPPFSRVVATVPQGEHRCR